MSLDYNVSYRKKDKSIQCIISYKENVKWRQKSKQGFKAQKDAKPWIKKTVKELEDKINLAKVIDLEDRELTFKQLSDKYVKHKRIHREGSTINLIISNLKKFEHLDDMKVSEITKADCQYCVDLMVKEGLSITTIKSYIGRIKGVFYYAINDMEIMTNNPLNKMTIPEDKEDDSKIKVLTKFQLSDLISKIDNSTYKLITMIAGTCGLRIGEIIGLTWDKVNLKESTLRVDQQWKTKEGWTYEMGKVKRKKSIRTVPIPPKALEEFKTYKKLYPIHTTKRIFYTRTNTGGVGTNLTALYKKLGYDITPHMLRHTYATHLIANGLDFKTVAYLMGHDVQETIKTYSHVTDDMIENATNVIDKIF